MSYETKAGVAVSCSFLCLVGVVLTSKLWDGQAANAGAPEANAEPAEVAGPNPMPFTGGMAPESTIPKLQNTPGLANGVQQVQGTGPGRAPFEMNELFHEHVDPFQQEPLIKAEGPKIPPAEITNSPASTFNNQPTVPSAVTNQAETSPNPKFPFVTAGATITDPKKNEVIVPKIPELSDFDAAAKALREKAAAGEKGGSNIVDSAPKIPQLGAGANPAAPVPPPAPTIDAVLAAQKKAQEEAAALNGGPDPKKSATEAASDDLTKELARQKALEQAANAEKDKSKEAAASAEAALAKSRQQLNDSLGNKDGIKNGFNALTEQPKPTPNDGLGNKDGIKNGFNVLTEQPKPTPNAGLGDKDGIKNGFNVVAEQPKPTPNPADAALGNGRQPMNNGSAIENKAPISAADFSIDAQNAGRRSQGTSGAPVAPVSMNSGTGTPQPGWPATGNDGYPGRTETAAINTGSRPNPAAQLGSPTPPPERSPPPERNAPSENQYAQLRDPQPPPASSGPPPIGTRPEVSVQPIKVTPPRSSSPAKKDNWDDRTLQSRAGDTYQILAQAEYNSDRYAQALMLYNRDYPLATPATQRSPETIVPGQTMYLPPARILQRMYGSVIPDQSASPSGPAAVRVPAPTTPVVTAGTPLPEKRYRVPGGGAMFLTIARTKLGDETRWPEIYLMNTNFDPTNLIPGGTVLRIPGDAKLDPADVPVGQ